MIINPSRCHKYIWVSQGSIFYFKLLEIEDIIIV